jgi:hypothetical protein
MKLATKHWIIPLLALLSVITLLIHNPIRQDQTYHDFADKRNIWLIPNFLNVITNLPFAIVGLLGLRDARNLKEDRLKLMFSTLFAGCLILTFGSGYYHWSPKNTTLVYDRIPIVIILMSFFAFIIYTFINKQTGYKLFLILNVGGFISVMYWAFSESIGKGDLRWYGLVQFFPVLAIPLILILYNPSPAPKKQIIIIFCFFGLAKLAERLDEESYHLLFYTISGHSLKHLFMVVALYHIVVMMRKAA